MSGSRCRSLARGRTKEQTLSEVASERIEKEPDAMFAETSHTTVGLMDFTRNKPWRRGAQSRELAVQGHRPEKQNCTSLLQSYAFLSFLLNSMLCFDFRVHSLLIFKTGVGGVINNYPHD